MPEYKALREIPRGNGTYIKAGETFTMDVRDAAHWIEHELAVRVKKDTDAQKPANPSGHFGAVKAEAGAKDTADSERRKPSI